MVRKPSYVRGWRKFVLVLAALLTMFGITQAVVIAVHEYSFSAQQNSPFELPSSGYYEYCCKAPTIGYIDAHYFENGVERPPNISARDGAVNNAKTYLVTGYTHSFWSGCELTSGKGKAVAWYGTATDPCPSGNPNGPGEE